MFLFCYAIGVPSAALYTFRATAVAAAFNFVRGFIASQRVIISKSILSESKTILINLYIIKTHHRGGFFKYFQILELWGPIVLNGFKIFTIKYNQFPNLSFRKQFWIAFRKYSWFSNFSRKSPFFKYFKILELWAHSLKLIFNFYYRIIK